MKLEIRGGELFDGDGKVCPNFLRGIPNELAAELARRVNGWEEVIGFIREVADELCACLNDEYGNYTCFRCRARDLLRKAGV